MRTTIRPRVELRTERGTRAANEDAVTGTELADGRLLVVVADGMGGHSAGDVASRSAVDGLAAELDAGAGLIEAVQAVNASLHHRSQRDPDLQGMGTTLLALLFHGSRYELVNVGDSRAYRIDGNGIEQLTTDHSFAAEAIRRGELSPEEAARSPWRHALTRVVGTDPTVEPDLFGPFEVDAAHQVLLCTDGVYKVLGDAEILGCALRAGDMREAADRIVQRSLEKGSDDNVSVALVSFELEGVGGWEERMPTGAAALPAAAEAGWDTDHPAVSPTADEELRADLFPVAADDTSAVAGARARAAAAFLAEPRKPSKRRAGARHSRPPRWTRLELVTVVALFLAVLVYVVLVVLLS